MAAERKRAYEVNGNWSKYHYDQWAGAHPDWSFGDVDAAQVGDGSADFALTGQIFRSYAKTPGGRLAVYAYWENKDVHGYGVRSQVSETSIQALAHRDGLPFFLISGSSPAGPFWVSPQNEPAREFMRRAGLTDGVFARALATGGEMAGWTQALEDGPMLRLYSNLRNARFNPPALLDVPDFAMSAALPTGLAIEASQFTPNPMML